MLTLTGTFLASERKTGSFVPDGETESRAWDYTELRVLAGDNVVKVRLPKDVHEHDLTRGDDVELSVTVPDRTKITTDLKSLVTA